MLRHLFAEGVANQAVMYELMSGDAYREIHDPIVGASLYESPGKYLEQSPDLQFAGLPPRAVPPTTVCRCFVGVPSFSPSFARPAYGAGGSYDLHSSAMSLFASAKFLLSPRSV